MITLKHMARTLDISPFKCRVILRQIYGTAPGKRWRWKSETEPAYKKALTAVKKKLPQQTQSTSSTKAPTTSSSTEKVTPSPKGAEK